MNQNHNLLKDRPQAAPSWPLPRPGRTAPIPTSEEFRLC